jgi:hypothetical protein
VAQEAAQFAQLLVVVGYHRITIIGSEGRR